MMARIGLSVIIGLLLVLGTINLWLNLEKTNEEQIARIAEAESYAARSQLIRNFDTMLTALRNVRFFWSEFGHLPRDQWTSDAGVELEHVKGVEMVIWDDPKHGIRYVRTPQNLRFDYRPGDEEWRAYSSLLAQARQSKGNSIVGPHENGSGKLKFFVIVTGTSGSGILAAVIDIESMFDAFLDDQSPGFAVRIKAGDTTIYQRGTAAPDAPESWTRGGRIRSAFGSIWMVEHFPTEEMVSSFGSPAIDMTLLLGLVIAILVSTLIFENWRARSRAAAAEVAEQKVIELNRGLEQTIVERTKELADRSADLQMLTDSVAHDLRNPLNSISVSVELLNARFENILGDDGKRILSRLSPSVHRMTSVLDRLTGLSRVANATFERKPVAMRDLVAETFDELNASESTPTVRFDLDALPDANADEKLVRILYLNLLGNALKYTRDVDDPHIRAGFEYMDDELVYFVADNGIGFDEQFTERIFAAFTQVHSQRRSEGVGLGLTLARNVVARHGGRIWAKGRPGEGATFYFTLAGTQEC